MIQSDYHMHSSFSGDSDEPIDKMIEKSIDLNLKNICFTEHYDPLFPCYLPGEEGMFDLNENEYMAKAKELRRSAYNDKINLNFGIELGIYPGIYDVCQTIAKSNPYDFIICSSHTACGQDPYQSDYWEGKSIIKGATDYFLEILENVKNFNDFDVYGHLDYCLRYTDSTEEDKNISNYYDIIKSIFDILIANGKGIEINSNGLHSKLKEFNPSPAILMLYKECKGEIITFGSDAHSCDRIASYNKEAEELLKSVGFKYYTVFSERKPSFISL